MTNMQAAIGLAQLERLDNFLDNKRAMGARYTESLSNVAGIQLPLARTEFADNIYWVYGLVLTPETKFDAHEAMRRLANKGVGTRPFFFPMHWQPALTKLGLFQGASFPVAEHLSKSGFYIPSGLALQNDQYPRVISAISAILSENS